MSRSHSTRRKTKRKSGKQNQHKSSNRKPNFAQVYQQLPIIKLLTSSKNAIVRRQILKSPDVINCISSIFRNARHGRLPIKDVALRKRLQKLNSRRLDKLSSQKTSIAIRRKYLLNPNQRGGAAFIPILAALLPTAISFISSLLRK